MNTEQTSKNKNKKIIIKKNLYVLLGYFIAFWCNGKSFAIAFLVYFKFTPVLFSLTDVSKINKRSK